MADMTKTTKTAMMMTKRTKMTKMTMIRMRDERDVTDMTKMTVLTRTPVMIAAERMVMMSMNKDHKDGRSDEEKVLETRIMTTMKLDEIDF